MRRFLGEPVLHFALLGALLFTANQHWGERLLAAFNPQTIRITAEDVDRLTRQWMAETGRPAEPAQMHALIRHRVDEELLFREALRLDLQRGDPVILQRLINNIRFIQPDSASDPGQLLDQAYQMGMLHSDLVVRRRLIQKMKHRIESRNQVTEAEVKRHYDQHPDTYTQPPRYRFTQLFFATQAAASEARQQVSKNNRIENLGEPFLLGRQQPFLSQQEIEQRFGTDIARWISEAETDTWSPPLPSAYGHHLIRINAIIEPRRLAYRQARHRAVAEVYAARDFASIRQALDALREQYRIVIEAQP